MLLQDVDRVCSVDSSKGVMMNQNWHDLIQTLYINKTSPWTVPLENEKYCICLFMQADWAWLISLIILNGFPWFLFIATQEHFLFVSTTSKNECIWRKDQREWAGSICLLYVFRVQLNVIVDVGSGSFRSTRWKVEYFLNKLALWHLYNAFIYGCWREESMKMSK